jgi:hypothetical protein
MGDLAHAFEELLSVVIGFPVRLLSNPCRPTILRFGLCGRLKKLHANGRLPTGGVQISNFTTREEALVYAGEHGLVVI